MTAKFQSAIHQFRSGLGSANQLNNDVARPRNQFLWIVGEQMLWNARYSVARNIPDRDTGNLEEFRQRADSLVNSAADCPAAEKCNAEGLRRRVRICQKIAGRTDLGAGQCPDRCDLKGQPTFSRETNSFSFDAIQVTPPPPAAPSGLSASAVSTNQINLAWTDNSTTETGFKIERSTDQTNWTAVTTTAANVTSYSDTPIADGTRWYYRVRATDEGGDSANITADTTTPLAVPTNPSATATSSTQMTVGWTDNSVAESGYVVDYSTSSTFSSPC